MFIARIGRWFENAKRKVCEGCIGVHFPQFRVYFGLSKQGVGGSTVDLFVVVHAHESSRTLLSKKTELFLFEQSTISKIQIFHCVHDDKRTKINVGPGILLRPPGNRHLDCRPSRLSTSTHRPSLFLPFSTEADILLLHHRRTSCLILPHHPCPLPQHRSQNKCRRHYLELPPDFRPQLDRHLVLAPKNHFSTSNTHRSVVHPCRKIIALASYNSFFYDCIGISTTTHDSPNWTIRILSSSSRPLLRKSHSPSSNRPLLRKSHQFLFEQTPFSLRTVQHHLIFPRQNHCGPQFDRHLVLPPKTLPMSARVSCFATTDGGNFLRTKWFNHLFSISAASATRHKRRQYLTIHHHQHNRNPNLSGNQEMSFSNTPSRPCCLRGYS